MIIQETNVRKIHRIKELVGNVMGEDVFEGRQRRQILCFVVEVMNVIFQIAGDSSLSTVGINVDGILLRVVLDERLAHDPTQRYIHRNA